MDIKTDSSAVIATLNKRIENLERYNSGLANESCEQQRKIAELETSNKPILLRQLNYDLRIARNGLKIVKRQAHVVYQENQDLKREVDRLKVKLQNANEDKLATISAERKRWAREDFNALAIRDLEQRANTLWFALENITNPEIIYNSRKHVLKEIQTLKDQS
jgi:hypothetical protein